MRTSATALLVAAACALTLPPLARAADGPIAETSPFQIAYYATADTHTLGDATQSIRKGQLVWFKTAPAGNAQDARMENGETRQINPADFTPLGGAAPAPKAGAPKAD